MSDNIKELAKRLRQPINCEDTLKKWDSVRQMLLDGDFGDGPRLAMESWLDTGDEERAEAADALEAMAANRDLWRDKCVLMEAERDRLRAVLNKKLSAKAREKLGDLSESMIVMGDGHSLEILLKWYDESRKAIEGDAS